MSADLSGLEIGSLTLTPTFSKDVEEYTAESTESTAKITATPAIPDAEIAIQFNGEDIDNEDTVTFDDGLNSFVVTVTNGDNVKSYTVSATYYEEKEFSFTPSGLTADETYGLSSDTVEIDSISGTVTVESAVADNEHISVSAEGGTLTVSCDDDTIFTQDAMPYTVTVTGKLGNNPATGSFEITYS